MKLFLNKVYVIRESNKGWSETYAIFLNKEQAEKKLNQLLEIPKAFRNNFNLVTWYTEDTIIYETDEQ